MKSVCVRIHPHSTIDAALSELENLGLNFLYSLEDEDGSKTIYGTIKEDCHLHSNPHVISVTPFILPKIDWESQFKDHGLNYHDGYVHVDLKDFGCPMPLYNTIRLKPGPGFGDLSHPTTALVLKLMNNHVQKKDVLDVGCGSGILTIAALSMGAKSAFGIDIDEGAIEHSKINAILNGMGELVLCHDLNCGSGCVKAPGLNRSKVTPYCNIGSLSIVQPRELLRSQTRSLNHDRALVSFGKAVDYKVNCSSLLILMNMIQSDQIDAVNSLLNVFHLPGDCLISGILKKDKEDYLKFAHKLNWQLVSEIADGDWVAFHFTRQKNFR